MNAKLALLLLRLSEACEPAILWGRQAKPHFGKGFDWLLADGVLIEQAPADAWNVCSACECGADRRAIQRINGQIVAACPLDRNADTVLEDDDLRSFQIARSALVRVIARNSGFDASSEVAPGVWRLGATASGRAVFLTLPRNRGHL